MIGVGDLAAEAVRLTNSGTRPLALRDWHIADEDGNVFTFTDITLFGSTATSGPLS